MKSISGFIFSLLFLLFFAGNARGQDTLRTFGPRIGIDLARLVPLFSDPSRPGAELNLDFELMPDLYPVLELGFAGMSDSVSESEYSSQGVYGRAGIDYNILPLKSRDIHHTVTLGIRYAYSRFAHEAQGIVVHGDYWGDFRIDQYENSLNAHWIELVGGLKVEVLDNLFLGWAFRYRILLNPDLDPQLTPLLIPGFGEGTEDRGLGMSYTISYKIPLMKK